MLKNYIRSAIRNFSKNKGFSLLNIIGLAIGIASSLLIMQYVKYEKSYDKFNTNSDRIYRLQYNNYSNGELNFECAAAVPASGPALKENFAEVLEQARLLPMGAVVSYDDPVMGLTSFREVNNIQVTESSIFKIFNIEFISGNPETCIDGGGKVAISAKAAEKYFGQAEAIGQTITFDGGNEFEVSAVFADLPSNSHIKFDFLISQDYFSQWFGDRDWQGIWGWYDHNTYVLLDEGVDYLDLQSRWDDHLLAVRGAEWAENNSRQEFILQPLHDIHLYSNLLQESRPAEQGDGDAVYFLTIIAFFILLIAWVNYINLSTAKSMERANEVGVRKVMGAGKNQLTIQFLMEAFILNLTAAILGVLMVFLTWPVFTELTGREIAFTMIYEPQFWGFVALLFIGGTILSGFYPALVISSFQPVKVLKGKIFKSSKGAFFRKSLVVFQFTVSVVLIAGTIIVLQQLRFMKNKDLGININQTLVIKGPGITDSTYTDKLESFKTETNRITGVMGMTASSNVPGNEIFWTNGIRRLSGFTENVGSVYKVGVDHDYLPSFKLTLLAGRNFSKDFNDDDKVILNKSLATLLNYTDMESAIGEKVSLGGDTLEIAGIIDDYHQMSLKNDKAPIVFFLSTSNNFFAYKIDTDNYQKVLTDVESQWAEFFPGNPFDYFFLDEFFNKQYDSDRRFSSVFSIFSFMAIFVACMGLFGLASFMTSQRTKEIGIRKALGSSVQGIVGLLSSGFVKLVLVSNLFALPLAWWVMDLWLQSFPYHINVSFAVLLLSGFLVIIIALLSVSFQTVKAALVNPASTLRYE
jgi:putative ABC transport system permease protein